MNSNFLPCRGCNNSLHLHGRVVWVVPLHCAHPSSPKEWICQVCAEASHDASLEEWGQLVCFHGAIRRYSSGHSSRPPHNQARLSIQNESRRRSSVRVERRQPATRVCWTLHSFCRFSLDVKHAATSKAVCCFVVTNVFLVYSIADCLICIKGALLA